MSEPRFPLADAQVYADQLLALMQPFCERIMIAGSIRRKKETVKDIEIIAVPHSHGALFADPDDPVDLSASALTGWMEGMIAGGMMAKHVTDKGRQTFGPRMQRVVWAGWNVDVFQVADPKSWGYLVTVRTGSAEFVRKAVTPVRLGGYLRDGLRCVNSEIVDQTTKVPLPIRNERDFFNLLTCGWIEPEARL
jgi:DNA polymerase/3'-5' exonuclease PolX